MDAQSLKEKYSFKSWSDSNDEGPNTFIWKFFLSGNEIKDWNIYRNQNLDSGDNVNTIISQWEQSESKRGDRMLRVEVFESNSLENSRETLLRCLANFESPEISIDKDGQIGEISFGHGSNNYMKLFLRANLVIAMNSLGSEMSSVAGLAGDLDSYINQDRKDTASEVNPRIESFSLEDKELTVGSSTALSIEATDPLERPLWYKFVSQLGEIDTVDGQLRYKAVSKGTDLITATAINENNGSASVEIQVQVN